MSSSSERSDSDGEGPFLVKVFHRPHSLFRADEFERSSVPPPVSIYTWGYCTLNELALELADVRPSILPSPAIGTRLVFQLVYLDDADDSNLNFSSRKYTIKDLGTVVVGDGLPGAEPADDDKGASDGRKTLDDARFVIGDYISCAILPPTSDGSVAYAETAKKGDPLPGSVGSRHQNQPRNNGPRGRGGRSGRRNGPGYDMGYGQGNGNWSGQAMGRSGGRGRW